MRLKSLAGPALVGCAMTLAAATAAHACPNANYAGPQFIYSGGDLYNGQAFTTQATGTGDLGYCNLPEAWGYAADLATMSMNLSMMQGYSLTVEVTSDCDSTLLLNAADGSWHFDDDSAGNLMPRLTLNAAQQTSGRVDVWIGTYSGDTCPATINFVTARLPGLPDEDGDVPPQSGCPNPSLMGNTLSYAGPQLGMAQRLPVQASGYTSLADCGIPEAWGYADPAPSYSLFLSQMAGQELALSVDAECDSTMLVRTANGQWHFNDDGNGNLDPRIELGLAAALEGRVDIWVGSYSQGGCPATLNLATTSGNLGGDITGYGCPNPAMTGQSVSYSGPQLGAGQALPAQATGSTHLGDCGVGDAWGYANAAPSYSLFLSQMAGHDLRLSLDAQCDSTMLVRTADGQWHFNDDGNGNLDPLIELAASPALDGRVDVWVGSYGQNGCPATLNVQTVAAGPTGPQGVAGLIDVLEATYGANCGAPYGNVTWHIAGRCNGLSSCDYSINYREIGDPAPGCAKTYEVAYACGDGSSHVATAPAEAGFGSVVTLQCSAMPPTGGAQDLFGTWNINANNYRGRIEFLPIGNGVWTGTMNLGYDEPITDIVFNAQTGDLRFERPGPSQVFTGTVSGDTISGTFTYAGQTYNWSATLDARG